jgi:integrase/recombinase XerC
MVKMSKSQIKSLTVEEQAKFLAHFYRQDKSRVLNELRIRDRLIVLLMLDAGLRVGEVIQLTVGDLHILGSPVGMIQIRAAITKTKTERSLPVTIRLHDTIQERWLNVWQPFGYKPWTQAFAGSYNGVCLSSRRIQQMTKAAGITTIGRPVHPHMLRHTFATRLMSKCSIRVVQQLLGHASLSSTQVYTHPNTQDLQAAIDSLNT